MAKKRGGASYGQPTRVAPARAAALYFSLDSTFQRYWLFIQKVVEIRIHAFPLRGHRQSNSILDITLWRDDPLLGSKKQSDSIYVIFYLCPVHSPRWTHPVECFSK